MPAAAHAPALRSRIAPRSGGADRVLDHKTEARIRVGELASPIVQALRPAAFRLWCILRSLAYVKKGGIVARGYGKLAEIAGVHVDTVRSSVRQLVDAGLLLVRRCFGMAPDWSSPGDLPNEYQPLAPPDAVAAFERRKRREAGLDVDDVVQELEQLGADQVRDPGEHRLDVESLEETRERIAMAAVLAMQPAIEAQLEHLAQLEAELARLPTFAAPSGWQRFRHFAAAQCCLRAIAAKRDAARAILSARMACHAGAGQLTSGEAGPRGWAGLADELRLALGLSSSAAPLVAEAARHADDTRRLWLPLLMPPARPAATAPPSAPASSAEPTQGTAPAELAAARLDQLVRAGAWSPPPGWSPTSGMKTPKTWAAQRLIWREGMEKPRARLLAQGFDPEWPDPPIR